MNSTKPYSLPIRAMLVGGGAAAALMMAGSLQAGDCRPDGSDHPGDCTHYNAGTVVMRPVQPNVADEAVAPLGDIGFSISIDGAGAGPDAPRHTIAGAPARPDRLRGIDRMLKSAEIDLTYDGLGARPRLAIATTDLRRGFTAGETVRFRASSNYPDWIAARFAMPRDERWQNPRLRRQRQPAAFDNC